MALQEQQDAHDKEVQVLHKELQQKSKEVDELRSLVSTLQHRVIKYTAERGPQDLSIIPPEEFEEIDNLVFGSGSPRRVADTRPRFNTAS